MPALIRQFIRYAVNKAASDPDARDKALRAGRVIAEEAGRVAKDKNRAYAAGRAFKRILKETRER